MHLSQSNTLRGSLLPGDGSSSSGARLGQRGHGLVAPEDSQAGAAERHEHDAHGGRHAHERVGKVCLRQQEAQRRALHACARGIRIGGQVKQCASAPAGAQRLRDQGLTPRPLLQGTCGEAAQARRGMAGRQGASTLTAAPVLPVQADQRAGQWWSGLCGPSGHATFCVLCEGLAVHIMGKSQNTRCRTLC